MPPASPNQGLKDAKIPAMSGNGTNGVVERISAVERDQAVTNTRLNTLTDTVQTLVNGVNDIKMMLQNSRGGSGKVSWGTLGAGVAVFLPVLSMTVGLLVYVIRAEVNAESLVRRSNDTILNDRLRFQRNLLRVVRPEFPEYPSAPLLGE